ncbi:MAG: glycosyltransferase [Phycisphaerales bacterium]|nr:glycosyltransferase [Phycisphaerales bacterium]
MNDPTIIAAGSKAAQGRFDEAVAVLRRAAAGRGDTLPYLLLMAEYLAVLGQNQQALFAADQAVQRAPARAEAHAVRGLVMQLLNRFLEATASLEEAVRLSPGLAMAHQNLGLVLQAQARFEAAETALRRAVELSPSVLADANLALLLADTARVPEAISLLEGALSRWPGQAGLLFPLCFLLNYSDTADPAAVLARHKEYGRAITPSPAPRGPAPGPRPAVLRVGLVSGDLRGHSVSRFVEPVLREINRERFGVTCYFTGPRGDATSARLRTLAERWRDVARTSDDTMARTITNDNIDILVDLAGLTSGQRLPVFARRAAPVQATWIGYPNTTGIPAMDFRIVDSRTDPPGSEAMVTESLVRLPGCLLCFDPGGDAPPVQPREPGPITFGSFNALSKVSDTCVRLWAAVLEAAPGSRLLLKAKALADGATRRRLQDRFVAAGLAPERLELIGQTESTAEHLALYQRIDIALDTFPYHGATTTCEALWMGVPVVTRGGTVHAARVGPSLLRAAGLSDLIADCDDGFVRLAASLAADPARLAAWRGTLRERLTASALCDAPAYARALEAALDAMWAAKGLATPAG